MLPDLPSPKQTYYYVCNWDILAIPHNSALLRLADRFYFKFRVTERARSGRFDQLCLHTDFRGKAAS